MSFFRLEWSSTKSAHEMPKKLRTSHQTSCLVLSSSYLIESTGWPAGDEKTEVLGRMLVF